MLVDSLPILLPTSFPSVFALLVYPLIILASTLQEAYSLNSLQFSIGQLSDEMVFPIGFRET